MSFRNITTALATSAALVLGGTAIAQTGDPDQPQPNHKAFVRDSEITAKVKTKLASEHLSSLARIHVDTDPDGVVYLSGTAPTEKAAKRAVKLAEATEGVTSVKSDIRVHSGE